MSRSIKIENQNLGSYDWKIPRGKEANEMLQGYLRPQYIKCGEQLSFHTSSKIDSCKFIIRIYRLGWYNGAGAKQVYRSSELSTKNHGFWTKDNGFNEENNFSNHIEGMDWPSSFKIQIPDNWISGIYIAKFSLTHTDPSLEKSYIHPFWICSPKNNGIKIAVVNSLISSQCRNWWGGENAVSITDRSNEIFSDDKSIKTLSFNRPHYNPRGGDALRWNYPLIKWLEKNNIDIAFHTDLELENDTSLLDNYTHIITSGPTRYWTEKIEDAYKNTVECGNHLIHLGSEAGQYIVRLEKDKQGFYEKVVLSDNIDDPNIGPRLENKFFSTTVSGKNKNPPWNNYNISREFLKIFSIPKPVTNNVEGLIGLSWDKSKKIKGLKVVSKNKIKQKMFSNSYANSHILEFPSKGRIFNAGVSNWTWALENYSNHGNVIKDVTIQRLTLELIGLDHNKYINSDFSFNSRDNINLNFEDYKKLLMKDPHDFDSLLNAGIYLWDNNQFREAELYFEKAVNVNPKSLVAVYRLARNHHKLQNYEDMLELYEKLLRGDPENMTYQIQYCELLINLQDYEKAEIQIKKLEDKSDSNKYPDLEIRKLTMLASCALKAKRLQISEDYCTMALIAKPEYLPALVTHARIAHNMGDYFLAEQRWKLVLKQKPSHYSAIMGIARADFKKANFIEGETILKKLINDESHNHRIWPYIELINLTFNHLKDYEYTARICKLLFQNLGENMSNHRNIEHIPVCHLALSLSKLGKYDESIDLLSRYLKEDSENAEYKLALSQVYREKNQGKSAFEHFKKVFENFNQEICNLMSNGDNMEISVENLLPDGQSKIENGPLISVIMTAYKATDLIEVAINSILNQTYQNFELIVIDDASPDDTFEQISTLAKLDKRIIPIKLETNGGTYVAKNHGLLRAKGKYVAFHDSDDWCHPDKLKLQIQKLEQNSELVGVTTGYIRVDENSNIIYRGKGAIRHACISLMFRRDIIMSNIGFFDSVRVSADSEFERRIHTVFGKNSVDHFHIPMIVASVRSDSLSGGGKFALDWTGLSGPRLDYRKQFELFHDRIRLGKQNAYISFPLHERAFKVPSILLTG
ncbi:MAG: hypothetical protein CMB56_006635 [Methanobacteriota archaeon]|nr:MAG: hypothetical protein CMB56_006635 [Euryarchaeota archaeon]